MTTDIKLMFTKTFKIDIIFFFNSFFLKILDQLRVWRRPKAMASFI